MKKVLLVFFMLLGLTISARSQCDTTFPMLSSYAGRVPCDSTHRFSIMFIGTGDDYLVTTGIAVMPLTFTDQQDIRHRTWLLDCKPATQELRHTLIKMINFSFNENLGEFDYFINEFIDTSKNKMLSIAFGSIHNKAHENNTLEFYLLPIDREEPFARFHNPANLSEVQKYTHTNGSYLYEIYDNNVLCGIRYYSITNEKEYRMFFR